FRHLDQLLVAGQLSRQQRVGEDLAQARDRAAGLALKLLRLDVVDRGELEDELDGQRPLVALDQVEIGRRDAEPLGHRRLGEALAVADAADARSREDLLVGHPHVLDRILQKRRSNALYNIYKFTSRPCQAQDSLTRIFA